MNVTSNILGALGRALRLSSPSTYESLIAVPPTAQPTLSLRGVTDTAVAGGSGTVNDSFSTLLTQQLTNTTSNTTHYWTIKQGLWEFNWRGTYGHIGSGIVNDWNNGFSMFLQPAAGGNPTIYLEFLSTASASGFYRLSGTIIIALPSDMDLITTMGTTALNETKQIEICFQGAKLL